MPSDPHADIRELVARCIAGDAEAWERFVGVYSPFLAGVIDRKLRKFGARPDAALVQDLLQEVFATILRDDRALLSRFRWDGPLEHYLAKVAFTRCVDHLRRSGAGPDPQADSVAEDLLRRDLLKEGAPDPRREAEQAETSGRIRRIVGELPRDERLAVQFFYWDGIPSERIGRVLGLSKEDVWNLLARARRRLADSFRGFRAVL